MTQGHHGGTPARPLRRKLAVRPRVRQLEDRALPSTTTPVEATDHFLAIGAEAGNLPYVRVIDTETGATKYTFLAYKTTFRGGVHVATGDVNGDGVPDIITAPGAGGGPLVKVWDGATGSLLTAFMAYDDKFRGGVYVAAGDVNGDGHADIITGAGQGGGPHVKVFNGAWVVPPFHTPTLTSTVPTAGDAPPTSTAGDGSTTTTGDSTSTGTGTTTGDGSSTGTGTTTGDGSTTGTGTTTSGDGTTGTGTTTGDGPTTTTGDGSTSTGGDTTSTGGDTTTTTTPTTPPPIDIWTPVLQEFMAYDMKFRGGVRVAAGDVSGDGKADIITAPGKGGGPHIRVFDATTGQVYREFMAFGSTFTGGVYVTAGDIDGDGQAEITVSTGANGGARVNTFDGESGRLIRTFAADSNPTIGLRVRMIDFDQDGQLDILVADGTRVQVRDPRTNAIKTSFTPLDPSYRGSLNLG